MQERIQTLITRLDKLLENGEIDQKTYAQMREVLEKKLKQLQPETNIPTESNDNFQQIEQSSAKSSPYSILSELEDKSFELNGERPPRELITYLKAKKTYREQLDAKNDLIEQGIQLREKYQNKQISRTEYLRKNSDLSQRLSKFSEALEARRTVLFESRPRMFQLQDQLTFLKKKRDALEKALSLKKIDDETYLAINQEITGKIQEIKRKIQLDVEQIPKWIDFFEKELKYRENRLKQTQAREPADVIEREQQKIDELLRFIDILRADSSILSSVITEVPSEEGQIEVSEKVRDETLLEAPIECEEPELASTVEVKEKEIVKHVEDPQIAWSYVGKRIQSSIEERGIIGFFSRPLVRNNQLYLEIVKINEVPDVIVEEIYNIVKPSLALGDATSLAKRREVAAEYVSRVVGIEKQKALSPTVVETFFKNMKIPPPEKLGRGGIKTIGLAPLSAIQKSNRKGITIEEREIEPPTPDVQLAFAEEKFSLSECVGSVVRNNMGQVLGTIKDVQFHPVLGQIMLLTSDTPRSELFDKILDQTKQATSRDLTTEEKIWLIQFLVSKHLEIYETEALKPENLISFCLIEGIPILPNEIRSSYLSWISAGFIRRSGTEFILLGTDIVLRPFPAELYEVEYKRVITEDGKTLGYALGVDYIQDELKIIYASHFSEKLIPLICETSIQGEDVKSTFTEMKTRISNSLDIPLELGLMPSNIFRYLLKEKLKSPNKRTSIRKSFETMKKLFKIEIIDFKDVQIKENEIIW